MKNDTIKLFLELISASGCFWLLFAFYNSFRIRKFIIKRYEQETDLLDSIYFKKHATFTRYLPNFFSSALYISHLITFLWGWNYFKKRKAYRDIEDANEVIRHFSNQEIRRVKWFAINGAIFIAHGIAYLIFLTIWPEVFR
jgi:hypothetical protein